MTSNPIVRKTVMCMTLSLGLAVTGLAAAQTPAPANAEKAPAAPVWKQKATHGSWEVICAKPEKKEVCQVVQALETRNEQDGKSTGQRLLRTTLQKQKEGIVLSFELPFGIDLRPGMVYQIDGAKETTVPFLTCVPGGCLVSTVVTDDIKKQLTSGKQMKVGFRPLGSEKVVVIDVSLDGLGKAFPSL
ncbi:MAG: invasion associated locus B family protein [Oxalicibacterium faecigallinarum]|uniref:invasion associated locus B family protein n=1 Tax=Oxalicibacterium faecigallinarum TaxID=573741 RepID=UPI00280904AA|nr:invasion associated locus B family protein [Oxalicibacterium faecigallinarum]MDQ7970201.1 invasion associated locus B family protein [Oxalicibacterium faecigallinarum]